MRTEAKDFLDFLSHMARDAKAEAKRLKRIDDNCVRIRREEIKLVSNRGVTLYGARNW